jgi:hypothetical protein
MKDYSGFYYNKRGTYENLVYYVSTLPEQKLYMIRKYTPIIDTKSVLRSIETGFNGYNYEIYAIEFLSFPFTNPNDSDEHCVIVNFTDFSNRQVFDGVIIVPSSMPNYDEFFEYLMKQCKGLPLITEYVPEVKEEVEVNHQKPRQQPIQQQVVQPQVQQQPVSEQLITPQMKAQQDARSIASQIVQNNERDNNNNQ